MNNSKNTSSASSSVLSFDAVSLVKYKLSDELLANLASSGSLRTSSCRSAVWRLLLRCLPYEIAEWEVVLSRNRHNYRVLKKRHLIDPRDDKFPQDPQLNNPLAPIEQNPWNTFFEDNQIRDIIRKDVTRTFPEIEFFQQEQVQQQMSEILLVYAKEHPDISYKQGMHEILAPLLFVIYSDIEAFHDSKEKEELKALTLEDDDILSCLFCKEFLENDSYDLFQAFMLEVSKWYEDTSQSDESKNSRNIKEPYLRVQDQVSSTRLMEDLLDIGQLLNEIDPTVAKHLNTLDIPPQLYGIRWLRLLFGRELPLHDLLFLWDVLLIDRPIGPLVKCVFVSLLVQIRHLLLASDYGGCLQYLMRYPPIADMDSFIELARHYRSPKKIAKPNVKQNNFTHITVAGTSHPNKQRKANLISPQRKPQSADQASPSILTFVPVFEKVKNSIRDRSNTVSVPNSPRKDPSSSAQKGRNNHQMQKMENWTAEIQLMEEQVSALQIRLYEKDSLCAEVSKSLVKYADDARAAKTSAQCEKLANELVELSKSLLPNRNAHSSTSVFSQRTPQKQQQNIEKERSPPPIRQSNEMIDLNARKLQRM